MNLKALMERRAELQEQMQTLLSAAETENRALSEEEAQRFDALEQEIKSIDETVAREERARALDTPARRQQEEQPDMELRAFENYIRTGELRTGEQNLNMDNNGAIVPTSIANRIITTVRDLCPILAGATRYNVPGTLKVPVWGKANSTHGITVGYQSEFTDITADSGAFSSVDLSGYLAGALTLIGRSVINNATVPVTDFIVNQMGEEIAVWIEKELLTGSGSSAATGALSTTTTLTAASSTAITADELISLQAKVKQAYQRNACWTMHPDTFVAIKKLKDSQNRYLLQDDYSSEFPYRILGKPVYLSDNMPTVTTSAKAVLYGDYSGLSVNFRENISIEILREKYATQHAIGVVGWFEFDSKITDNQKLAVLTMKGA